MFCSLHDCNSYQNFEYVVWRFALDVDAVDLDDLVSAGDESGPVGRPSMHHSGNQDPTGTLLSFDCRANDRFRTFLVALKVFWVRIVVKSLFEPGLNLKSGQFLNIAI